MSVRPPQHDLVFRNQGQRFLSAAHMHHNRRAPVEARRPPGHAPAHSRALLIGQLAGCQQRLRANKWLPTFLAKQNALAVDKRAIGARSHWPFSFGSGCESNFRVPNFKVLRPSSDSRFVLATRRASMIAICASSSCPDASNRVARYSRRRFASPTFPCCNDCCAFSWMRYSVSLPSASRIGRGGSSGGGFSAISTEISLSTLYDRCSAISTRPVTSIRATVRNPLRLLGGIWSCTSTDSVRL